MKLIKTILLLYFFMSILESAEYIDYQFEIFSISMDAKTSALGGIATHNSMSIDKIYSLNKFHNKKKTSFSYGQYYSGLIDCFQMSRIVLDTKKSKIGISLLHKKIENIPNTEKAWLDLGNSINQSDIDYNNISYYSDQQISLIFLYSYNSRIGDIGFKIKPFYSSISKYNSIGFTTDIGITKYFSENMILGLSIDNLISINKWSTDEVYSYYPNLSSMITYFNNTHLFISEVSVSSAIIDGYSLNTSYKIGYENSIYEKIKLQFGYSSASSFSFGLSFDYKNKNFSYSFNPNLNNIILGHNHQFSILLDLPDNLN